MFSILRKSAVIMSVLFLFSAVSLSEASPLSVVPDFSILPIVHGVTQKVTVNLSNPALQTGEEFEIHVKTESGMGVLLLEGSPFSSGRLTYKVGEPLVMLYRWSGPFPTENAVNERITVSVPSLQLTATTDFSVGMDLRVKEVKLPSQVAARGFTPIKIIVEDSFHPGSDVASILAALDIKPELKMSLESVGDPIAVPAALDAVTKKFFGTDGQSAQMDASYPGKELIAGSIMKSDDNGSFCWMSSTGREPGIMPQYAGEYRLSVSMKSNTGGLVMKTYVSEPFKTAGADGSDIAAGIPDILGSTVRIISGLNSTVAESLAADVRGALKSGSRSAAVTLLGSGLRRSAPAQPQMQLPLLGRYVQALSASGMSMDALSAFMTDFLKGYGDCGALVLTRSGVKSWSAVTSDKVKFKTAPDGRMFLDDKYLIIPFELGKNFTLNISGSNSAPVSLWKMLPSGVNTKKYPQGSWNKEITVYTEQLMPPALPAATKTP